jgi:hypothetical protein
LASGEYAHFAPDHDGTDVRVLSDLAADTASAALVRVLLGWEDRHDYFAPINSIGEALREHGLVGEDDRLSSAGLALCEAHEERENRSASHCVFLSGKEEDESRKALNSLLRNVRAESDRLGFVLDSGRGAKMDGAAVSDPTAGVNAAEPSDPTWEWGVVNLFGRTKRIGRMRQTGVLGVPGYRVESFRDDGNFDVSDVSGAAIFERQVMTEWQARRAAVPQSWCCLTYAESLILPSHCSNCGCAREEHERTAKIAVHRERAAKVHERISKYLASFGDVLLRLVWNRNDTEGARVVAVLIRAHGGHQEMIHERHWNSLLRGGEPLVPWDERMTDTRDVEDDITF